MSFMRSLCFIGFQKTHNRNKECSVFTHTARENYISKLFYFNDIKFIVKMKTSRLPFVGTMNKSSFLAARCCFLKRISTFTKSEVTAALYRVV